MCEMEDTACRVQDTSPTLRDCAPHLDGQGVARRSVSPLGITKRGSRTPVNSAASPDLRHKANCARIYPLSFVLRKLVMHF